MRETDAAAVLGLPVLEEQDRAVYAWMARHADASTAELVAGLGLTAAAAESCVERLCRFKLLSPLPKHPEHPENPERYLAVSPQSAGSWLLETEVHALARRQRAIDEVRVHLSELTEQFEAAASARARPRAVEIVTVEELRESVIPYLADRATAQLRLAVGDDDPPLAPEILETLLDRGVAVRLLYPHAAQFSRSATGFVRRTAASGAEVRTRSDGTVPVLVFDRTAAVLEAGESPGTAALAHDPSVVEFAAASFDQAWAGARVFPAQYDHDQVAQASNDIKAAILRLLVDGLEDRIIARRLGISLRTGQRHISEIIAELGARSRLQAGYLIARHGLMDRDPEWPPAKQGTDGQQD